MQTKRESLTVRKEKKKFMHSTYEKKRLNEYIV